MAGPGHRFLAYPTQAPGPPRQAMGPPQSGAGVGVGMLRGIEKFDRKGH